MTEQWQRDLWNKLVHKITVLENGCWFCSHGGDSPYGSSKFEDRNIGNHQASWIAHNGYIPDGKAVLHSCDYRRCINPGHLFLGTNEENRLDMFAKSRNSRGEDKANALLTEDDVRKIRVLLAEDVLSQREIGDQFGVEGYVISFIKNGRTWAHVR